MSSLRYTSKPNSNSLKLAKENASHCLAVISSNILIFLFFSFNVGAAMVHCDVLKLQCLAMLGFLFYSISIISSDQ